MQSTSLLQLGQLVKPQVSAALDVLADFCLAHQSELQGWFEEPVVLPSSQRPLGERGWAFFASAYFSAILLLTPYLRSLNLRLASGHIALERFLHANLLASAQYTTAAEILDSEAILERKSVAKVCRATATQT